MLTSAELEEQHGSFDVITSVEVIEHVVEPMVFLQQVADLLAPGGIFIVTTGNVERLGQDLAEWSYVVPDVHVTFLGPTALKHAYGRLGLKPEVPGFQPGHVEMIRFKILKTLGRRRTSPWERLVPWWPLTRLVDRRYGISAMPFARKPYGLDQGSTGTGSHGSARQTSA